MAVLVTGGAGYIGSHMVLELVDAGEKVVVLDDLSTGFRASVPPEAILVQGDVGDQALIARLIDEHGIDAIAHFAAKILVAESVSQPLDYYHGNTVKSRALLEAAIRAGVKQFIFSSTAAVYGEPEVTPVPEDAVLSPINPYGRSKLVTEWMIEDAARAHGLRYAILRYFNVAGADPKGRSGQAGPTATHILKVAAQVAIGIQPHLQIYGTDYATEDGSCIRDYVQVTDLARAHTAALKHLRGGGESLTVNCGYGRGFSVLEVVDVVKRVSGIDFEVRIAPRRPGDPAVLVAKAERIRETLGWTPAFADLPTIADQALRWERHLATLKAA